MAKKRNPFSLSNLKNPAVIGGGSLLLALLGMLNRSSEVEPTGELDDISELIEGGNLAPGGDFPSEAPFQIQGEGLSSDGVHDTLNNNIMLNELLIQMNK